MKYNKNQKYILQRIHHFEDAILNAVSNKQFIRALKKLKSWMEKFAEALSAREAERSFEYELMFCSCCGPTFFQKVLNTIEDYYNGVRPYKNK